MKGAQALASLPGGVRGALSVSLMLKAAARTLSSMQTPEAIHVSPTDVLSDAPLRAVGSCPS